VSPAGFHAIVSGTVQGVCFRAYTQAQAQALHLTGWVRNLADGTVELQAFGSPQALKQLQQWLQHGPKTATVTDLQYQNIPFAQYPDFQIH
jgi:acylphosphatase